MKKVFFRLTGLAILAAAGWGGYRLYKQTISERLDTIGPNLHSLFRSAISCARQARAGTTNIN